MENWKELEEKLHEWGFSRVGGATERLVFLRCAPCPCVVDIHSPCYRKTCPRYLFEWFEKFPPGQVISSDIRAQMKYRNFEGGMHLSTEDECLHGRVLGVNDMVTYEATGIAELRVAFQAAVDSYLKSLAQLKEKSG